MGVALRYSNREHQKEIRPGSVHPDVYATGSRQVPPLLSLYGKSLPTMPRYAVLCCAALCCATVCRAILNRVAWLVVSFLYSFVGKSVASLVFKRRVEGRRQKENDDRSAGAEEGTVGSRGPEGTLPNGARRRRWSGPAAAGGSRGGPRSKENKTCRSKTRYRLTSK